MDRKDLRPFPPSRYAITQILHLTAYDQQLISSFCTEVHEYMWTQAPIVFAFRSDALDPRSYEFSQLLCGCSTNKIAIPRVVQPLDHTSA